jgi:hypothetical protein
MMFACAVQQINAATTAAAYLILFTTKSARIRTIPQ